MDPISDAQAIQGLMALYDDLLALLQIMAAKIEALEADVAKLKGETK